MRATHIVVCCYGYLHNRTLAELAGYQGYLEGVANLLFEKAAELEDPCVDRVDAIFCGGETLKGFGSESEEIVKHLVSKYYFNKMDGLRIFCEKESLNTEQNIARALELIGHVDSFDQVIIVCDAVRQIRVQISAKIIARYLGLNQNPRVVGIPRQDIHPQSRFWYQLLTAFRFFFNSGLVLRRAGLIK